MTARGPIVDRDQAVDWLMGRINYERVAVVPYGQQAMKLEPVRELLSRLGDPQAALRIVHVAGTKGKGSTGAMIAAALEAAGVTTGVYSSPHLERLEERFAVGGQPCSADELVQLVDKARPIAEAMDRDAGDGRGPTFFDLTTAMALAHFAERRVGTVVLEVGLGGRLDSTNVVTPAVSVITSISLDHMKQLGDTRAEIAAEKAGILKPGVPAVSGVTDAEADDVIERIAGDVGAPLWRRGRDFDVELAEQTPRYWRQTAEGRRMAINDLRVALPGAAQAENAAVALATLDLLGEQGFTIPEDAKRHGVAHGRLPGRLERFPGEPLVVVDGAHNDASAEALAEALDTLCDGRPGERRVLVVAASRDKAIDAILGPLVGHVSLVVATRYLDNPRAESPEVLATAARAAGAASVTTEPSPEAAYTTAKQKAGAGGAVVFAGSLLFAAEARRLVVSERGAPLG